MGTVRDDPQTKPRIAAFVQRLEELGWTDGRNVRIEYRWGAGEFRTTCTNKRPNWSRSRRTPLLASGTMSVTHTLQATRTVPIVFALVADPVGAGFVESLSRPGGNATGLYAIRIQFEWEMAGIAQADRPGRNASGELRDPAITSGIGQFAVIQSVAPAVGIEVSPVNVRDAAARLSAPSQPSLALRMEKWSHHNSK